MSQESPLCPTCHVEMQSGMRFCTRCGSRLDPLSKSSGPRPLVLDDWPGPAATQSSSPIQQAFASAHPLSDALTDSKPNGTQPAQQSTSAPETLEEVDVGFEILEDETLLASQPLPPPPPSPKLPGMSAAALKEQVSAAFKKQAAAHLASLRDAIVELELGAAPAQWLEMARSAALALRKAAEPMLDTALNEALDWLGSRLDAYRERGDAEHLRGLKEAYASLARVLPEAGELERERKRREQILVASILQSTPGLGPLYVDRLHAAGLTKLARLTKASVADLTREAQIPSELAEELAARVAWFQCRLDSVPPDPARLGERSRVEQLVHKLREYNQAFSSASRGWSPDAMLEKQRIRKEREQLFSHISLLLARLGEAELVQRLERLPFERKVQEIEQFLSAAERKYAPPLREATSHG